MSLQPLIETTKIRLTPFIEHIDMNNDCHLQINICYNIIKINFNKFTHVNSTQGRL